MDMHVAITADVQQILEVQGLEVDVKPLSAHAWVLGRDAARVKGIRMPGKVSSLFKRDILHIDEAMCDRFYEKNRDSFSMYDGFIVSYPPAFAMLFERFEKPVVTVACTRFDFPCQDPSRLIWLSKGLTRMHAKGSLIPIANNLLDQALAEKYMPFGWRHVPSLCDYMTQKYQPEGQSALLWSRSPEALEDRFKEIKGINNEFSIRDRYDRNEVKKAYAVIHLLYQVSIMSAFEQYAQAIPMLVPTKEFMKDMYSVGGQVLSEVLFPNSQLELPDNWLDLADFYDDDNFRHIIKFDSFDHLEWELKSHDMPKVSCQMALHQAARRQRVHSEWRDIIKEWF